MVVVKQDLGYGITILKLNIQPTIMNNKSSCNYCGAIIACLLNFYVPAFKLFFRERIYAFFVFHVSNSCKVIFVNSLIVIQARYRFHEHPETSLPMSKVISLYFLIDRFCHR